MHNILSRDPLSSQSHQTALSSQSHQTAPLKQMESSIIPFRLLFIPRKGKSSISSFCRVECYLDSKLKLDQTVLSSFHGLLRAIDRTDRSSIYAVCPTHSRVRIPNGQTGSFPSFPGRICCRDVINAAQAQAACSGACSTWSLTYARGQQSKVSAWDALKARPAKRAQGGQPTRPRDCQSVCTPDGLSAHQCARRLLKPTAEPTCAHQRLYPSDSLMRSGTNRYYSGRYGLSLKMQWLPARRVARFLPSCPRGPEAFFFGFFFGGGGRTRGRTP
jgi:hypothetical protein